MSMRARAQIGAVIEQQRPHLGHGQVPVAGRAQHRQYLGRSASRSACVGVGRGLGGPYRGPTWWR